MRTIMLAIFAILTTGVLVGCGGSKSSSSTAGTSGGHTIAVTSAPSGAQPRPKESLQAFEQRTTAAFQAAAAGNCGPAKTWAASAAFNLRCTPGKAFHLLDGFKVTGSATYGTGAVIEYTDAETAGERAGGKLDVPGATPTQRRPTAVLPLALGPDGRYQYVGAGASPVLSGPFIGTPANDWSGADAAAVTYLKSVRDADCNVWFKYTYTPQGMSKQQACKLGLTQAEAGLRSALKSLPVKLYHLSGNSVLYFYGMRLGSKGGTLVVGRQSGSPPFITIGLTQAPNS